MYNLLKNSLLVAAAVLALGGQAEAGYGGIKKPSLKISDSNLHDPTTIVFEHKNNKYQFKELDGSPVSINIKAKKVRRSRITEYRIYLNQSTTIAHHGIVKLQLKDLNKTYKWTPKRQHLKAFEAVGLKLCKGNKNPNNKVVHDKEIKVWGHIKSEGKNTKLTHWEERTVSDHTRLKIVCEAKTFKVTDVKLSVQYHSNPNRCPVKATLKAVFTGNRPGTFDFKLYRHDGKSQIVTKSIGDLGQIGFFKNYTLNKTTDRKYKIYILGQTQTSHPQNVESNVVTVKATCNKKPGAGGFKAQKSKSSRM